MNNKTDEEKRMLDFVSLESKHFYSAGTTFSLFSCAGIVHLTWFILERFHECFSHELVGIVLSAMIVYAYAWVIPEPKGYIDEGQRKITKAEYIFGFFNTFVIFAITLGLRSIKP